jgi:TonB-dependent SusC/RagA subfamily outer membrane receptor
MRICDCGMKIRALFTLSCIFLSFVFVEGQESSKKIVISGIVTDEFKNPIPGATITVDGKKSSLSTDKKGKYKIKLNSSVVKIGIFTSAPLKIEEAINGRTEINFSLDSDAKKEIQNQEVNKFYETEKRNNVSTQQDKINRRYEKYDSYSSVYDLIRGEVPGVKVEGTRLLIRENFSQMGGNEALLIVDGTSVNSIDGLLPQDVHSIEVIKGSAASIYGTRGSNGVILITLRNAKNTK